MLPEPDAEVVLGTELAAAEVPKDEVERFETADFTALLIADVALAALVAIAPVALVRATELDMVMPVMDWAATIAGRMKTAKCILMVSGNGQLSFMIQGIYSRFG